MVFLKPKLTPYIAELILFGPGVKVVIKTKIKSEKKQYHSSK